MQKCCSPIDRLSTRAGQLGSWAIIGLTLLICWEVFYRYFLNDPHSWVYDAQWMLYGVLFAMAGPTRCQERPRSRRRCLRFSGRAQATIDIVLYILFFARHRCPDLRGLGFANDAWKIKENTFSACRCRSIHSNL